MKNKTYDSDRLHCGELFDKYHGFIQSVNLKIKQLHNIKRINDRKSQHYSE